MDTYDILLILFYNRPELQYIYIFFNSQHISSSYSPCFTHVLLWINQTLEEETDQNN